MKINDNTRSPRTLLRDIELGEVFLSEDGDLYMKLSSSRCGGVMGSIERLCAEVSSGSVEWMPESDLVVPLNSEITITNKEV